MLPPAETSTLGLAELAGGTSLAAPAGALAQRRPGGCALPTALAECELAAMRARRSALALPLDPGKSSGRVGLAISGGGIRSATFALGVLQSLAGLGRRLHDRTGCAHPTRPVDVAGHLERAPGLLAGQRRGAS